MAAVLHWSNYVIHIAPTYLASCPKQGLGLLEILLHKQPVKYYPMVLKNLEIFRLYELENMSSNIMKQWEGLIELLGSEVQTIRGLKFLHRYRDFKKSLQQLQDGKASDVARQTIEALIQIMKNPSTPRRFWLPLLYDSVKLLNWQDRPLLNSAETNMLLNKLQDLSVAKLRPDLTDVDLPVQTLNSLRLSLATNLGRAMLEES